MLGFPLALGTRNLHMQQHMAEAQAMDESGDHLVSYREFFGFVKSKAGTEWLHGELRGRVWLEGMTQDKGKT